MHHLSVLQQKKTGDDLEAAITDSLTEGSRDVPVYHYKDRAIWGITAMLLLDFSNILRDALKR